MVKLINQLFITFYCEKDRFTEFALIIKNDLGDQSDMPRKKFSKFLGPNSIK